MLDRLECRDHIPALVVAQVIHAPDSDVDGEALSCPRRRGTGQLEPMVPAYSFREENSVSGPLIFITTARIKEGKLEDYKRFAKELLEHVKAKEPQVIAINIFLNEDGTEMTSIQLHPNAASMESHLQVLNQVLGEEMSGWVKENGFPRNQADRDLREEYDAKTPPRLTMSGL